MTTVIISCKTIWVANNFDDHCASAIYRKIMIMIDIKNIEAIFSPRTKNIRQTKKAIWKIEFDIMIIDEKLIWLMAFFGIELQKEVSLDFMKYVWRKTFCFCFKNCKIEWLHSKTRILHFIDWNKWFSNWNSKENATRRSVAQW